MADERLFGEIPGYPEGSLFTDRAALQRSGVHRPGQAGISGGQDGADSIVVSGGYVDDEDRGNEIIYTGQGGRDSGTSRQIADQELTRGNLGLVRSEEAGHPVRVVRGSKGDPRYSPTSGYRYDGLYRVTEHWQEVGKDGFKVWRFRLNKLNPLPDVEQVSAPAQVPNSDAPTATPEHSTSDAPAQQSADVDDPELLALPAEQEHWASDAPADKDMLKRDALASVIAARLRRFSHNEPGLSFLLHVDGPWGSGKSTLLKFLGRRLDKHYLVVPFDSWKHAKVDPPWWALLVTLRQHVSQASPWWRRIYLRFADSWARARRGSTPYLLTGLVVLLFILGLVLIKPTLLTVVGTNKLKNATTWLTALGSISLVVLLVSRFMWWDSARGARRLEQVHTNPMQEVAQHFSWLLARAPRRVVFFIDDLDRCGDKYVVELLDAVQTLIRDAPKRKGKSDKSAYFIVAAHGNWLRRAYETVHQPFQGAVDEPGRKLGHLFLDKLFQLTIPVPTLGQQTKQLYFDHVLGIQAVDQPSNDEQTGLLGQIDSSTSEREVLEILQAVGPQQREMVVARAVEKMSEPIIAEVTEHALQKFAPLLDGNPRSMKRFANTYSVLRAARTLEGITVDSDVLAFWTILSIRWPMLTEYLAANLNSLPEDPSRPVRLDSLPDEYKPLQTDVELRQVLDTPLVRLTSGQIKACCGAVTYTEHDEADPD
ncbi:YDG/SRA domain-containing protein [Actinosynnema sp. ALI-1.44]|uniref:YDG/SRA domain-containing protein n=1 Tax=Actinosynnema sp. ALI-1.44 TaxID=1933779 RepID=UPI000A02EA1C|nr:YDG/SRA domain-containing protein [Actinosynnema sp. ALI-1.44]